MKKVKVMLAAIVLFAAVGGALAFKARTFGKFIYTTNGAGPLCPLQKVNFTITDTENGTFLATSTAPDAANPNGYPCVNAITEVAQ